jgi:mannose-6-phosphate isomerase-like protein (cupin superfamily)
LHGQEHRSDQCDIRSIRDVPPGVEHGGTTRFWWLVKPHDMHRSTVGGFFELFSEWEVAGGGEVAPHRHPTHEFYYVTTGRGIVVIDGKELRVSQGDLIYIPPDALHSARPVGQNAPLHALAFAIGVPGAERLDYEP